MRSGPVAQLGARFHGMEEVVGSIPTRSTIKSITYRPTSKRLPEIWPEFQEASAVFDFSLSSLLMAATVASARPLGQEQAGGCRHQLSIALGTPQLSKLTAGSLSVQDFENCEL